MNNENYISEEVFEELVNGLEFIESFTLYGRKSLKYHIKRLQEENQQLKEQLQQKEDIINEITNYCKFQIEKEQDKFPKPIESEEWLKGRISAFEEILDDKGE